MNSILQTLNLLPAKLYEIDLSDKTIGEFLDLCQASFNETMLTYASQRIEELDRAILESPKERGDWKVSKSEVTRAVETKYGLLEYKRRYYKNSSSKDYCYLVDQALGIRPYQRVEDELSLSLAEAACTMSYRESTKHVCSGRVSAMSVKSAIAKINIPKLEEKKTKRRVEELHIQADEDHIHLQGQRVKSGQLRFVAVHEPKVETYKGRYELTRREILSSVDEKPGEFGDRVLDLLDAKYDLAHVKRIYFHGDGANWIKGVRGSLIKTIPILDHFHLEKKLLGVCRGDRRLRNGLRECLNPWDDDALTREAQMLVDSDVCTDKKASELLGYLENNKEGIINHFTLDHGGSCAEGLVSHVFSRRFSRDPMSWSLGGVRKLSEIRVHLENGGKLSRSMLHETQELDNDKENPILSAAKSRVKSSRKVEPGDWRVPVPGSSLTSGAIGAIIKGINRGGYYS